MHQDLWDGNYSNLFSNHTLSPLLSPYLMRIRKKSRKFFRGYTTDTGTMEAMEQRMGCFVRQYGDYEGERPRPSARFTLAENIADNGAIRASYSAWHQFRAENPGRNENLPAGRLGQFSEEQLFFISSAFMYCAAFPQGQEEWYTQNDNHGFPRARVNLPLRNFPAFARAFQCPEGSPMHPPPERQCRLW